MNFVTNSGVCSEGISLSTANVSLANKNTEPNHSLLCRAMWCFKDNSIFQTFWFIKASLRTDLSLYIPHVGQAAPVHSF